MGIYMCITKSGGACALEQGGAVRESCPVVTGPSAAPGAAVLQAWVA